MTANASDFLNLYDAMMKCKKGVAWKDSVARFCLHPVHNLCKMERELKTGKFRHRNPHKFILTHPKRRDCISISFRDRVPQRSLNDNYVYPMMTRGFIRDNWACQKGKGTDRARRRMKEFLQKFYRRRGTNGYILCCDVHGYYANMRHDKVKEQFRKRLPPDVYEFTAQVLDHQYAGETGFAPGSQMVQIAGISHLNGLDHLIKEKLRIKFYLRYMDDFHIIHSDMQYLRKCRDVITRYLGSLGLELHHKKTRIVPVTEGVTFLGFRYRLTATGKVLMLLDPQNVKRQRRHLAHMVARSKRGTLPREKVDESFKCWLNHASKGNTFKVVQRMKRYYKNLWEVQHESNSYERDAERTRGT